MELIIYLAFFLVLCWAIFASMFAFQLYKENEDFARRLGRIEPEPESNIREYLIELQTRITTFYNDIYPKAKYSIIGFDKILRFIPIKIRFK